MAKTKSNGHPVLRRPGFESALLAQMDSLRAFGISLTGSKDRGEDLCQETFLKAVLKQGQFQPGTNLKAWLFTILRNEYHSQLRKSKREHSLDDMVVETFAAPREDIKREDEEEITRGFLESLPFLACVEQEQRDLVVAVHYLGFSYEETAYVFDIDVGTVKSRVSRGLEKVRQMMETQSVESFDLSPWATATRGVPKNHLYFPVAEAYEEMYAFLTKNSKLAGLSQVSVSEESDVDSLLRQIQQSGALDDGLEDLDNLMRE